MYGGGLFGRNIPQHPLGKRQLLVEHRWRGARRSPLEDAAPQHAQVRKVAGQVLLACILGAGADDIAAFLVRRHQPPDLLAQLHALGLVLDALRDADVRVLRQIDQHASGQAHLRRQARSLGADRILDDLHQHGGTFMDQSLDRRRLLLRELPVFPDVSHVQEGRAFETDVDERRLHARQHARDAPEKDVADQPAQRAALDVQFLNDARIQYGDPRLLRGDVDQNVLHMFSRRECTQRCVAHARDRVHPGRYRSVARSFSPPAGSIQR